MSSGLSAFLNLSRWAAAFLVLIGHVRHLILVDLNDVLHQSLLLKMLYFVTGLGHEAVVIFFVISGLLVGGNTFERWSTRGPNVRSYAIARVSRIYTVLIPALVVGSLLDQIGMRWFDAAGLYTNPSQYHTISLDHPASAALNLATFAGNVFMLQGILTKSLGSNNPLWSLSYEWWYYCLFAAVAVAMTGAGRMRIGYALGAIAMAFLLPSKIMLWGIIWCLGIAAHAWIRSRVWRPHPGLGIGVFIVSMVASRLSHNLHNTEGSESLFVEFIRDLGLAAGYCVALVSVSRTGMRPPFAGLNEKLAEFSYTTYLCHFPAMLFLAAVLYQQFGFGFQLQPEAPGVAYFACLSAGLCLWCFGFSRLTEYHTGYVRKRLQGYADAVWMRPGI
jgi:peptidoglycan/LPS O-acetylase OafA/YrhL